MPHYDKSSAECRIFTYKEGLLSAVGHDLELRLTRLEIHVDYEKRGVRARFDTASLEVVGAVHEGLPRPDALSDDDRKKIREAALAEVLDARNYPEARFISSSVTPEGDGHRVVGELTLHGKTRLINFATHRVGAGDGERQEAEVRLDVRDFNMKPYTAMLGALKVKPHVVVRISVPDSAARSAS